MKKILLTALATGGILAACLGSAQASIISWTDWTTAGTNVVSGSITVGSDTIGVTYSGPYSFAQTAGGTNYWTNPTIYTSNPEVDNAPPDSDIIALAAGGTKTIAFSEAVEDPIIALVSWNSNTVDFGTPIEILNFGPGFWGSGTPILNGAGTGFFGSGEVHGIIRLPGTFSSITFTDTSESWHGFTLGITDVSDDGNGEVPEPATMLLFGTGMACLIGRRARKAK